MTRRRRCGHWPGPRPAWPTASTPSCRSWPGRSPEPGSARPAAPPASSASGQSARITSRLLDLASPGSHSGSRSRAAGRSDPELAAEIRETTAKLAGPQWETLIRYAVATTAPAQARDGAGRWERRAAAAQQAARLRGLAHALASATALLTGRNWLARRRLRHPAAVDRRPVVSRRRPAVRAGTRRDRPAAGRPVAARPGPRRGTRRPAAARHPGSRPGRPPAGRLGRRGAPPGRPGDSRRPAPPADLRADRHRQDHLDRRADPRRRPGRPRRRLHRPQGRRRDRPARPPPRGRGGQGRAVRPRRRQARPAVPERAARRRVRHRHRHDRRQRHRDLPADLRRVLGTPHRRHLPRRVPDPARVGAARLRAGHPGRHPAAARRRRLPPPPDRRGPRPGAPRLLGLVRGDVPGVAGSGGRAADEQAPRVPAPQVRARRDRGRPVHLRHGRGPRRRRAVPGPAAQGHPRARKPRSSSGRSSSRGPGRPPPGAPGCPRPPARTPACTSTSARTS